MQMNYGRTLSSHQFNQTPNANHSAQDQTCIIKGGHVFDRSICLVLNTRANAGMAPEKVDFEGISCHKLVEGNITHLKDRILTSFTQKQEVAPILTAQNHQRKLTAAKKHHSYTQDINKFVWSKSDMRHFSCPEIKTNLNLKPLFNRYPWPQQLLVKHDTWQKSYQDWNDYTTDYLLSAQTSSQRNVLNCITLLT